MDKINFCISILNGQFKAASFRRGSVAGVWEGPELREDFSDLQAALKEGLEKTKPDGKGTAVVLALARLSDQILEIPPVKGRALMQFLQRQVQSLKTFPGEAVWSWQTALPTKKTNAALLHVMPRTVLDQLAKGFQDLNLQLVRVVPTSAVLMNQLKALPLQKDEVALLAAETGGSTTVVIGRKDGRVSLSRVLPNSWATAPEKVWLDLTRSIGFAAQQSGLTVNSVWLFGPGADAHLGALQPILKLPVALSPAPYTPSYWAEQAVKLSEQDAGNLISAETRAAPQRRRMLTLTGFLVFLLVSASLAGAGIIDWVCRSQLKSLATVNTRLAGLRIQHQELKTSFAELGQMEEVIRVVNDEKLPPLPNWFLGYLGQVVPDELTLNRLRITRTNDLWSVHLAGISGANLDLSRTGALQRAFSSLSSNLTSGPFHLAITHSELGKANPAAAAKVSGTGLLARFTQVRLPEEPEIKGKGPHPFMLEGVMR